MNSSKRPFVISFAGLKIGKHEFEFEIGTTFFEEYEYSGITDAALQIKLNLDKKETMLIGDFFIEGKLTTGCDRCMDPLEVPINAEYKQIFKFGDEESEDETLTVLHPDEYEIDVKDFIYEFILVSIPGKVTHSVDECNQEMMATMEKYTINLYDKEVQEENDDDDDEDDISPWAILKDFK